jgi:helicase-like protein
MKMEEVRADVVGFLRKELIGPDPVPPEIQANGEEVLTLDPPRLRYGAGVLFPQATAVESTQDTSSSDAPGDGAEALPSDPDLPEPIIEGEERTAGTDEDPSEAVDETVSLANAFLPSAMGLSTLAELPPDGFVVNVQAATYRPHDVPYVNKQGETKKRRQFLREPFEQKVEVPSTALHGPNVTKWSGPVKLENGKESGLEVRILSRPRTQDGAGPSCRLLTISLVNARQSRNGRPSNERCFFQVSFQVCAVDNSPCFMEYPEPRGLLLDEEEQSMAMLYRHRKTYAIGHGCAAEWNEVSEGRADSIRTEAIPVYELKPIIPTRFEDLPLRMLDLSDAGEPAPIVSRLNSLCDRYESWIEEQATKTQAPDFPKDCLKAAERHLENCRRCLERMRSGVALLEQDGTVMQAFRLANRAMLLQQLHYALPLREWQGKQGETPRIPQGHQPDINNPSAGKGSWYPFQLAFILMNLRSLASNADPEREIVDLIWFPTGGGKTEAYLGLTAFAILLRRLRNPVDGETSVLMRYTLRLLTAQQFQRAASLICALDYLRSSGAAALGSTTISIGLWVGGGLTPNSRDDALTAVRRLTQGNCRDNPFVMLKCPWCGAEMGPRQFGSQTRVMGYETQKSPRTVIFKCKDTQCHFSRTEKLPLVVIDEDIYETPPTLIIGTVDKFAMLPWKPEASALFGLKDADHPSQPPDLIIQDELHLISGPLGSMVGHYETLVQELCSRRDTTGVLRPKIIASTATISKAAEQCNALYDCGKDNVLLFPPQCLRAGDSFFAYEDMDAPGRLYVGVHASALPSHVAAQVRVISALLQAPLSIDADENERDPYWTLICYFNSLRELGHAATLIRAYIREYLDAMWLRKHIRKSEGMAPSRRRFVEVALELTSRIATSEIPAALQKLGRSYSLDRDEKAVDICLATNMISVGVDVPRLGLMTVVGQPKTTSEYIQATSRVGRRHPGLVVTVYNTGKPRDRSHYEHFRSYHASIYRQVEPTSVTPFATPVRERALHAILATLVRYWGSPDNRRRPQPFPDDQLLDEIRQVIEDRVAGVEPEERELTLALLDERLDRWKRILPPRYGDFGPPQTDIPLMYPAGSEPLEAWENNSWATPSSMRDVDATCDARVIGQYPRRDTWSEPE